MKNAESQNTGSQDAFEPEVTEEEIRAHLQKDVPGSSRQDVITLIFIAVMIIATVGCFVFLI
ncbi:MAG TPA: hypothetical protein H9751_00160 [Candidatus Corynebacterium faecigallinarum]|uniref:Uncharacterized protein n=1 Tax=Candidatus Corynebacterium faecigallinarum TaxID=2838528 RepID=A0A9D2QD60_9CORY|nr:hypothetical protein [Candidatus Corynebacterium faecigallinarum]